MTKVGRGRPKFAEGKSKAEFVICRVTKDEAKEIKAAATRSSKEKSDWVRDTLLSAARATKQAP